MTNKIKKESWIYTDLKQIRNRIDSDIYDLDQLKQSFQETLDQVDQHLRELERQDWD